MISDYSFPNQVYIRAARKAGWLDRYGKVQALACGGCILLETRPDPVRGSKKERRSLHGFKHSVGNDGRLPFEPYQLDKMPLDGDERCRPKPDDSDDASGMLSRVR